MEKKITMKMKPDSRGFGRCLEKVVESKYHLFKTRPHVTYVSPTVKRSSQIHSSPNGNAIIDPANLSLSLDFQGVY